MKKRIEFTVVLVFIFLLISSCEKIESLFGGKKFGKKQIKGTMAVCLGNDVPFYNIYGNDREIVTHITLGETVYWNGENRMDSIANEEYLNVTLSDGETKGWVPAMSLVKDADPGAVTKQTRIYNRPDTLTVTEGKYEFMDMVAVTEEGSDWVNTVGENGKKIGWIRKDDITLKKEDVASAIFARKKLRENNGMSRSERLDYILLNAPFLESYFIEEVRKLRALETIFYLEEKAEKMGKDDVHPETEALSFPLPE